MRRGALALAAGLILAVPMVCAATGALSDQGAARQGGPPLNVAPGEAGTGAISGVVTDAVTKAPLPGAIVYLGPPTHGPPGAPLRQMTDARGRFVFRQLPAFAGYVINVSKFGYFDGVYGRANNVTTLPGRLVLREGEWFSEANVALTKPSSISGRVLDHKGEPLVGVFVRLLPRVLIAGREHPIAGQVATTDDRGVYRVAGLTAGRYLVQVPSVQSSLPATASTLPGVDPAADAGRPATSALLDLDGVNRVQLGRYVTPLAPVAGRVMVFPPTLYPNTTTMANASTIELKDSEERLGIDFQLQPVPTFHVSGRLEGPADVVAGLTVRLLPPGLDDLGDGSEVATALVAPDGGFALLNVPAGSYTLIAKRTVTQYELRRTGPVSQAALPRPPSPPASGSSSSGGSVGSAAGGVSMSTRGAPGGDSYWARMPFVVDARDVHDVVVRMQRAMRMTGRFVFAEGEQPAPSAIGMTVWLEPANGSPSLGAPRSQNDPRVVSETFAIEGLMPGAYVLSAMAGQSRVKSVSWNGADYTTRPFDTSSGQDITDVLITLTRRSILLSGSVRDSRGLRGNDTAVIVFPVDRDQWRNLGFNPERFKVFQLNTAGEYRFQSLPAGDYFVIAVAVEFIDGWKDPEFLAKVASAATRVTLAWGDTKTQDLTMVTVR